MNAVQPDELRRVIAERVRSRRKELDITQAALAEKLGVTQPWVAQIENPTGSGAIGSDTIANLAKALQTQPSALLSAEQIFSPIAS